MDEKCTTLANRLREDAKWFFSKEEALEVLNSIDSGMKATDILHETRELYSFNVTRENSMPPNADAIGKWLEQNQDDKGYFAKPEMRIEIYQKRVPKDLFFAGLSAMLGESAGHRLVDAQRTVVAGFSFTFEMPYRHIRVRLDPLLSNLTPEECYILPIVSRTHLRLFWAFAHFAYLDWEKAERTGRLDWATAETRLKDRSGLEDLLASILMKFSEFVEEPLRVRLGPMTSDEAAGDNS
jgi:hypothetical protein